MSWRKKGKINPRTAAIILLAALLCFALASWLAPTHVGAEALPPPIARFSLHTGATADGLFFADIVSAQSSDPINFTLWTVCDRLPTESNAFCKDLDTTNSETTKTFVPWQDTNGGWFVYASVYTEDGLTVTDAARFPTATMHCSKNLQGLIECLGYSRIGAEPETANSVSWQFINPATKTVDFRQLGDNEVFTHPYVNCGPIEIRADGIKPNGEVLWTTGPVTYLVSKQCFTQNLPFTVSQTKFLIQRVQP